MCETSPSDAMSVICWSSNRPGEYTTSEPSGSRITVDASGMVKPPGILSGAAGTCQTSGAIGVMEPLLPELYGMPRAVLEAGIDKCTHPLETELAVKCRTRLVRE